MPSVVTLKRSSQQSQIHATVAALGKSRVLVGIPAAENPRKNGAPLGNAALLALHTHGSPLQGIPARPVLEPAMSDADNRAVYTKPMMAAAEAAVAGDWNEVKLDLDKAGQLAANKAKDWFTNSKNGWKPNSPATIARKGSDRPLIDTQEMLRSITWVTEMANPPAQGNP